MVTNPCRSYILPSVVSRKGMPLTICIPVLKPIPDGTKFKVQTTKDDSTLEPVCK